jgi:hypothetical protein
MFVGMFVTRPTTHQATRPTTYQELHIYEYVTTNRKPSAEKRVAAELDIRSDVRVYNIDAYG